MKFTIYILAAYIASSISGAKWDGLRVSSKRCNYIPNPVQWNPNVADPNYFVKYPRTERGAIKQGFTKIGDCDLTAKWRGRRYVQDDDYTVILLFDIKGYIAGIQTAITTTSTYPPLGLKPPFIDDGGRSVLTAYFTDPSKICSTGRSAEEFETEGTASNLYIQNSTSPDASTRLFSTQDEAKLAAPWTSGACVKYMGLHYYYNITMELECDNLFPIGLLYYKGQLVAFAWLFVQYLPLKRYEIIPQKSFGYVLNPVSTCLYDHDYITTQHVFLINNVSQIKC